MDIHVVSKEARPLLKRTEVEARIAFQGATPTKKQVVEAVAKATGAKHDLVIVRKITTNFGDQSAAVSARIYDDKKSLETLELKATLKKHGMLKEEKAGDAQAEPKKEGDA
jgi:small subunit ribosomal protein S24e